MKNIDDLNQRIMSEYENNFMALAIPIIEMYADNIKGNCPLP